MLRADLGLPEVQLLLPGQRESGLRGAREFDRRGSQRDTASLRDELRRSAELAQLDPEGVEDPSGNPFAFASESEEQVLGADVGVVEAHGLVLREREHPLSAVVKVAEWTGRVGVGGRVRQPN